ncbi:hypothetical protein GGR51DRAFT_318346 [Nemania sp. FL0031]|nr:hypothetical protein GGR51DRAFT_318346 [Nemania sp. FL0031]
MKSSIYISVLTALAAAAPLEIVSNPTSPKLRDGLVPPGTDPDMVKVKRAGTVDARDGLVVAGVDAEMLKRAGTVDARDGLVVAGVDTSMLKREDH